MNTFRWVAGTLLASMVLGWAAPSHADIAVPLTEVVSQLQEATQIPILLPSQVPMDEVFLDVEAQSDRYYVGFDYRPNCHSVTACHFGEIIAEQNGSMAAPENAQAVTLADGTPANFFSTCGAHCTASVQWSYGGVRYRVMVKNGDQEGTIALANSAVLRGDRRSDSSSRSGSEAGSEPRSIPNSSARSSTVRLIAHDTSSPINIRAGASTTTEALHIGYSGDVVEVIEQVSGDDSYRWYHIRFPQSGAAGWVRGDFIAP
jgi:Bacterial SH3 domain